MAKRILKVILIFNYKIIFFNFRDHYKSQNLTPQILIKKTKK